jgi:ABC-2 type transport system permease protein
MTTSSIPQPVRTGGPRKTINDAWVVLIRNLSQIPRVPERLADVTIQPVIFVLLFAFVFGSAISIPGGGSYREYLLPGIFVQTMAFVAITTAVGMATDMQAGLIDRFRSLPMARSAVLVGRALADLLQSALGVVVMSICGLLVGWRAHLGIWHTMAGFGLLLLFGLAMICAGILIGLIVRESQTAQVLGFIVILPMTFLSNTFVPTQGLNQVLRTIAEWNPVSSLVAALRTEFGNPGVITSGVALPLRHPVASALIWSLAILTISMTLAVRRYSRSVSR